MGQLLYQYHPEVVGDGKQNLNGKNGEDNSQDSLRTVSTRPYGGASTEG
jgi:hypothetical protein